MTRILTAIFAFWFLGTSATAQEAPDVLFADFEGDTYGDWNTTGTAFGTGPAKGTLSNQMHVSGFVGKGLVNSYRGGDGPVGTLTSPEFKVERKYISFLIGGGGYPQKTCLNLLIDGKPAQTATGPNREPGGSEQLEIAFWDVSDFKGKSARLEIVDAATGGWGHINVDQIIFTNAKPAIAIRNATRELQAGSKYLHLPVRTGASKRNVSLLVNGHRERWFEIELADAEPQWWASLDISSWRDATVTIQVDKLPAGSQALSAIQQSNELLGNENLYREPLRPQFHFSPKRGWNNDPNGLVLIDGQYHMFFQHNPYGWSWGNMHWGHSVSRDLIHWQEVDEALYPDTMGPMFSGSAVVDWQNTSGLGRDRQVPLVLFYTAAGNPTVQCLAFSNDGGKTVTKFSGNPIIPQITPGNRDPKVIWHEPTKRWVMVLYVELPDKKHTIHFFTSENLKDWKLASQVEGLFECPDLFPLPLDGNQAHQKWILTAASSEYFVGEFDGTRFTPETDKLVGHQGRGFYAAQTFSDIPASDGRRIQIGWLQAPAPGMPFNQAMSVPLELRLVSTKQGPRMTWTPVRELERLRGKAIHSQSLALKPGDKNPLAEVNGELLEIVTEIEPTGESEIAFHVRGIPVIYNVQRQQLSVNGHPAPAPLRDGKLNLRILLDRTTIEIFASGGLTYIPTPVIAKADNRTMSMSVQGSPATFHDLQVFELQSIWQPATGK